MKRYESVIQACTTLTDIVCDRCGGSCKRKMNYEHANITAYWGYESGRDEQVFDLDICESCFEEFLEWMNGNSLRGSVSTGGESGGTT
jgi:hypothetical protein